RPPPGVMHCFSSGRGLAGTAIALGFYVSISGIVTFRNAEDVRAIVRDLPLDRLLVETDAPYLAPVPYRGKRNEPAFVAATAAAVAALKGIDPEEIAAATRDNFFRLFTKAIPLFADAKTLTEIGRRFGYVLEPISEPGRYYKPTLEPHVIRGGFEIAGLPVIPFAQDHGFSTTLGLRIGGFAYSTDVTELDETAFAAVEGVEL